MERGSVELFGGVELDCWHCESSDLTAPPDSESWIITITSKSSVFITPKVPSVLNACSADHNPPTQDLSQWLSFFPFLKFWFPWTVMSGYAEVMFLSGFRLFSHLFWSKLELSSSSAFAGLFSHCIFGFKPLSLCPHPEHNCCHTGQEDAISSLLD